MLLAGVLLANRFLAQPENATADLHMAVADGRGGANEAFALAEMSFHAPISCFAAGSGGRPRSVDQQPSGRWRPVRGGDFQHDGYRAVIIGLWLVLRLRT